MKHFFFRALNKLRVLEKLNVIGKLMLNGRTFNIPVIKKYGYNNLFMSEMWMIELLQILLNDKVKKGTFIDVGVNIGQTLLKMRSVAQDMNYIGFEPNPMCVFYTNELIKANSNLKASNTLVYPVGISTKDQILTLNLYSEHEMDSTASIIEEFRDYEVIQKIVVPIFTASNLEQDKELFSGTAIVKIDVEGAELEVLTSMKDMINQERPVVLMEILPVYKDSNEFRLKRQMDIESIINEINYSFYRIEKSNNVSFSHLTKVETIGVHGDLELCDYAIIPNENTAYKSIIK